MSRNFVFAIVMTLTMGVVLFQLTAGAEDRSLQPSVQASGEPQAMQGMTKMHEQMMAEMKAADVRLETLVKEMNGANGDAKVTAIAAVVNELVAQHRSMHQRMGEMHQQMMGGRGMMMHR